MWYTFHCRLCGMKYRVSTNHSKDLFCRGCQDILSDLYFKLKNLVENGEIKATSAQARRSMALSKEPFEKL